MRPTTTGGAVAITRLRQAGFLLACGRQRVLVDPFLSEHRPDLLVRAPVTPEDVADVNIVLVSHEHPDHLDHDTLRRIAAASPMATFVVPEPVRPIVVAASVPEHRIIGARVDVPIHVDGLRVDPVPACHGSHMADAYTFGTSASGLHRFLGYAVRIGRSTVYHAGDTIGYDGMVERLRALAVDLALLPINGRDAAREARGVVGNLTATEAADLAEAIGVESVIPMHHDTVAGNTGSPAAMLDRLTEVRSPISVLLPGLGATVLHRRRR